MKYLQWNTNQNSVFHELNVLAPDGLIGLLGVEQLELIFKIRYSNRIIVESIEDTDTSAIAGMLHRMFYEKWVKLSEIYLNDFEVGFTSSSTVSSTNEATSSKELTTVTNNAVSPYNEDVMVDVSENGESINEVGTSDGTRNSTVTTKALQSVDLQRALLENSNIVNTICEDVAKVITLPIYN